MIQEIARTTQNRRVAPGHYVIELESAKIARAARPGQFVQILCGHSADPLLPRPFSFLDAAGRKISILYHVVGKGTAILERMRAGDKLKILGPLGNGFTLGGGRREAGGGSKKAILVGGGVGIPPLHHLAKTFLKNKIHRKQDIRILLGARTKSLLLCEKDFKRLGVSVSIATDDGSKGKRGLVTELLEPLLAPTSHLPSSTFVYVCGPTPMMRAASSVAQKFEVPCEVSVEVPMACGFGACLGCAIKVQTQSGHRFAIACCEGPVFEGSRILWD